MKAFLVGALVALTVSPALAQQPRDRRDAPAVPAPTGTASISGTVVAADDGHPLALASVVAIGAVTGTLKLTSTDRNGQFSFANLAADRYVVGASKPPYIGAVAGARRAARPGTPIVVTTGQKMTGVRVALPRGAVIAGTVYNHRGQPSANANVQLRQWKMQGDERTLATPQGMSSISTDESGRYRFYGVPPGEYLVSAFTTGLATQARALTDAEVDQALAGQPVDLSVDASLRAVPFFYPGTARPAEATPVVVNGGDERLGVDVRVELVRTSRVDGFVVGPDGQPPSGPNLSVEMSTTGAVLRGSTRVALQPGGRFAFPPSIPGPQILTASVGNGSNALVAIANIDTSAGDQLGIQLTLRPASSIAGTMVFEGGAPPPRAGWTVPVKSFGRTADFGPGFSVTMTRDTGAFQIDRVFPGRYLIGGPLVFGATAEGLTWALKSVVADDKDITDKILEVGAEAPPKLLVITYTNQWQQLSGKLAHQSGGAATDETVIVFPADRAYWYQGSRRIMTTRPASDGLFSFGGPGPTTLPPGEYLLAAVTDLGRDEQFDPSFLATLLTAAAPITIGPGDKKTQDLVIR